MSKKHLLLGTLAAAIGGFVGTASAQDAAAAPAAEAEVSASAPVAPEAPAEEAKDDEKENPMGWFGIGLKLGVAGVGSGDFDTDIGGAKIKTKTPSRTGFQLALPISMGGDGFGWDIEPYLNFSSGAFEAGGVKGKSESFTAMGAYTGPKFDIHVMDPLYVGFGFGLKAAWVASSAIDYGADLYGRVPIRGTYYLLNDLGLVAEFGIGYGASGYLAKKSAVDPKPDIKFGTAVTWDFTVGVRWP